MVLLMTISANSATLKLRNGKIGTIELIDTMSVYDSTGCSVRVKSKGAVLDFAKNKIDYLVINSDTISFNSFSCSKVNLSGVKEQYPWKTGKVYKNVNVYLKDSIVTRYYKVYIDSSTLLVTSLSGGTLSSKRIHCDSIRKMSFPVGSKSGRGALIGAGMGIVTGLAVNVLFDSKVQITSNGRTTGYVYKDFNLGLLGWVLVVGGEAWLGGIIGSSAKIGEIDIYPISHKQISMRLLPGSNPDTPLSAGVMFSFNP